MQAYPIDPHLPALAAALREAPFVLLKAEPGAGKTTRAPEALLQSFGRILVVQPRRLAARLAAEWVAKQSGQPLGQLVGYQIRLERRASAATRLLFVTEGVLTRMLLQDRLLRGFDLIVLDEFHERHVHTDVALALLKEVQRERPELRVLIMSATLDLSQLQTYLGDPPCFDVPGRTFPVDLVYRPAPSGQLLEEQVLTAVQDMLVDRRAQGNILVFLSGLGEIMSCAHRLGQALQDDIDIVPLTAELAANYERLFADTTRPKVILSTNVAETSVTLPNVRGVIDSGWAKVSGFAPWSGLPTLERQRVSQASCIQRMGRAGRIGPGLCYRLFSEVDYYGRAAFTEPEIQRIDLTQTLLEVQMLYRERPAAWEQIPWFEAPDPASVASQRELLVRLGAISSEGKLSADGELMSQLPLHPRLGRLVLTGMSMEQGELALAAALVINEDMLLRRSAGPREHGACDVSYQLQLLLGGGRSSAAIDRHKAQRMRQLFEMMARSLGLKRPWTALRVDEEVVRRCIFAAFADRVAKYRALPDRGLRPLRHYNFCQGRGGVLGESSIVRAAPWIVAVSARETFGDDPAQRCRIEVVSAVESAWIESDPFGLLREEREVSVEDKSGRARRWLRRYYGKLQLSEVEEGTESAESAELLAARLKDKWPEPFASSDALVRYHSKRRLLDRHGFEHKLPLFEGDYLELLLDHLCEDAVNWAAIARKDLGQAIEEQLDALDIQHLSSLCPDSLKLDNGRRLKVHYEAEGEPWVEAKIQEFFGQKDTPRICQGRQPLLCKLLAPSRRPAQITQDLRGFWLGSYHEVKKELKRRYPRHAWPEDPLTYIPLPDPKRRSP